MMSSKLKFITVLCFFYSVTVQAARDKDWIWLYESSEATFYYAHENIGEKFTHGGLLGLVFDNPRVWARVWSPNGSFLYRGKPTDELIRLYEVKCRAKKVRQIEGTYYYKGGKVIDLGRERWIDASDRASPVWLLLNVACK
jgi:hypothetical protein